MKQPKIENYRRRARLGGWLGIALQPISLLLIGSLSELDGMSARVILGITVLGLSFILMDWVFGTCNEDHGFGMIYVTSGSFEEWEITKHQPFSKSRVPKMKKVILTVLATATMGTTLVAPLMANAREVNFGHNSNNSFLQARVSYAVFYKKSRFEEWRYYGSYNNKFIAEATVLRLEVQGFKAYYAIPRG